MSDAVPGFDAAYLDGRSSRQRAVRVEVRGDCASIRGEEVELDVPLSDMRVQPRLGTLPLRIELPGGGLLVADAQAVARAMPLPAKAGIAHRLESHLGAVVASMVGVAVAGWFFYVDGIPWIARHAVEGLPPEVEAEIGDEGLEALDRFFVKPTNLPAERRERVHAVFKEVAGASDSHARDARLELRDGHIIGANALALPGGVVVVTDQLATLLDDERLAAVLAHEIGHLQHRHGARHILQDTIAGLVLIAVFGDASSIAAVAATAPTILLNNGYSRDFEREADARAYELLRSTGRSPRLLGEALAAIEKDAERGGASSSCRAESDEDATEPPEPERRRSNLGYISTHPATEERIKAAEQAALR